MKGKQLFEYHMAFRDYSGTDRDDYAQTLETAFSLFGNDVYFKLEQAEKEDKKIELIEDLSVEGSPTGMKLI
ncbi:MAG: hypothetical protein EOO42_18305 [Flavobacteriales bacterium]|nr:MAG: hypothetical protein EOO42_18305 [Flavobacteriales bacterium]